MEWCESLNPERNESLQCFHEVKGHAKESFLVGDNSEEQYIGVNRNNELELFYVANGDQKPVSDVTVQNNCCQYEDCCIPSRLPEILLRFICRYISVLLHVLSVKMYMFVVMNNALNMFRKSDTVHIFIKGAPKV